jgi:hypothetical protein
MRKLMLLVLRGGTDCQTKLNRVPLMARLAALKSNLKLVVPNAGTTGLAGWNGKVGCSRGSIRYLDTIPGSAEVAVPSSCCANAFVGEGKR